MVGNEKDMKYNNTLASLLEHDKIELNHLILEQLAIYGYPIDVQCSYYCLYTDLMIVATSYGHVKILGDNLVEYDFNINKINDYTINKLKENHIESIQLNYDYLNSIDMIKCIQHKIYSNNRYSLKNLFKMKKNVKQSNNVSMCHIQSINCSRLPNNLAGIILMTINPYDKQLLIVDNMSELTNWDMNRIIDGGLVLISKLAFKYDEKITSICMLNNTMNCSYLKYVCCGTTKGNVYFIQLPTLQLEKYCIYWNKACKGYTINSPGEIVFLIPNIKNNPNILLIGYKNGIITKWNISEKIQTKIITINNIISCYDYDIDGHILFVGCFNGKIYILCGNTLGIIIKKYKFQHILIMNDFFDNIWNHYDDLKIEISLNIDSTAKPANNTLQLLFMKEIYINKNYYFIVMIKKSDILKNHSYLYYLYMGIVDLNDEINSSYCKFYVSIPFYCKKVVDLHLKKMINHIYISIIKKEGLFVFKLNFDEFIHKINSNKESNITNNKENRLINKLYSPYSFHDDYYCNIISIKVYSSLNIVSNIKTLFSKQSNACDMIIWPFKGGKYDNIQSNDPINILLTIHNNGMINCWQSLKISISPIFTIYYIKDIQLYTKNTLNHSNVANIANTANIELSKNCWFDLYEKYLLLLLLINNTTLCVYSLDPNHDLYQCYNRVKIFIYDYDEKSNSVYLNSCYESESSYIHTNYHSNINYASGFNNIKLLAILCFLPFNNNMKCHTHHSINTITHVHFIDMFNLLFISINNYILILSLFNLSHIIQSNIYDHFLKNINRHKKLSHIYSNNKFDLNIIKNIHFLAYNQQNNIKSNCAKFLILTTYNIIFELSVYSDGNLLCEYLHTIAGTIDSINTTISCNNPSATNESTILYKIFILFNSTIIHLFKYEYNKISNRRCFAKETTYSIIKKDIEIIHTLIFQHQCIPLLFILYKEKNDLKISILSLLMNNNYMTKSFDLIYPYHQDGYKLNGMCCILSNYHDDTAIIFIAINQLPLNIYSNENYNIIQLKLYLKNDTNLSNNLYPNLMYSNPIKTAQNSNIKLNNVFHFIQNKFKKNPTMTMDYNCIFSKANDIAVLSSIASNLNILSPITTNSNTCDNKKINTETNPLKIAFMEREKKLIDVEMISKKMADKANQLNNSINKILEKESKKNFFF